MSLLEGAPGSAPLAGDTLNYNAWRSGRTLRVGDELYHVVVNPPSVLKARMARLSSGSVVLLWIAGSLFVHSAHAGGGAPAARPML